MSFLQLVDTECVTSQKLW